MESKKVKVLGLVHHGGTRYHRVKLPLTYLNGKFIEVKDEQVEVEVTFAQNDKCELSEDLVKNYDIIWTSWTYDNQVTQLAEWQSKYGFKIVQDIDDMWELPQDHIDAASRYDKLVPQMILADVVTTSTERLSAHCIQYNPMVSINPNYLPIGDGQFIGKPEKEEGDKINIGIIGSIAHYHDWITLNSVIRRLGREESIRKSCRFVLAGYVPESRYWKKILQMFQSAHRDMEVITTPYKDVDNYMEVYNDIDILLAPLAPSEFAECKSSLKIIESGIKGILVLGSPLYLDKEVPCVIPCETPKDYLGHIKDLIKDEKYKDIGQETFEAVKTLNHFDQRIANLGTICEYLMNEAGDTTPDNLKIFGITYDKDQYTEYENYDNSDINSVDKKSYLFEYNPIIDIIDNKEFKEDDYIGIFSHKFSKKTNVPKKILNKMFVEIMNSEIKPDIIGLSPTFLRGNYLMWSNIQHPGFLQVFSELCTRLGLTMKEPEHVIYSNFWLGKYSVYKKYVEEVVKPAIHILENEMELQAWKNSEYKAGLTKEQLMEKAGMEYYPMHTFLLERLLGVWLEANHEINFLQVL